MKLTRSMLRLNPGGLYRCCVQTFNEWVEEAPDAPVEDGEKITCRYEKTDPDEGLKAAQMVVDMNIVRWFDPDYPPLKPGTGEAL